MMLKRLLLLSSLILVSFPQAIFAQTHQNQSESIPIQTIKLKGKLIYKKLPVNKSVESYTGEQFFLITYEKKPRKLVLRSSEKVTYEKLQKFINKSVEIKAIYTEGKRPDVNLVPCPMDMNGQCMLQGEGYEVLAVKIIRKN
jgi:biopolymer transport protein ExbD